MSTGRASSEEIRAFWADELPKAPASFTLGEAPCQTRVGRYEEVSFVADDGQKLEGRFIVPRLMKPAGVVLELHDVGRGMRGWLHLSRWLPLGCAVLSFERRSWREDLTEGYEHASPDPADLAFVRQIKDATSAFLLAQELIPDVPALIFGEGLGAGLGLAAGALGELQGSAPAALALLNPVPGDAACVLSSGTPEGPSASIVAWARGADPEGEGGDALFRTLSYADAEAFAPWLAAPVLLGTSLLDTYAPPAAQDRIASSLGNLVCRKTYPRWAHERVNAFEDTAFSFFQPYIAF